jgi:two-component system, OmpR family, phosphate regulon sensor histidine kinase PhoR
MKKKKFVIWTILLMTFSLSAIIIMQTFQLLNSYKKSKEEIDRGVSQAITVTLETLQKQDAIIFVYDKLISTDNQDRDSVYPVDPYMISSGSQNIISYHENSYHIQFQNHSGPGLKHFEYSFFSDFTGSKDLFDIEQFLFEDFQEKKMRLQNIIHQLESEFLQRTIPVEQRFDAATISNILEKSLLSQGLNLNFEFAIIDEFENIKINSNNFDINSIKGAYAFNLIPGSIFSNPDIFIVYFPDKRKYALQTIYAQLGTSFLLTLLFIISFGAAIFTLMRQKKITEIKTDFINNMTHEFKTPIATIKLAAASIKNANDCGNSEAAKSMTDIITQETNKMNQHVEQVLQMAVMERQSIQVNKSKENLNEIIKEAVSSIDLVVEEKGGKINFNVDDNEVIVNADRDLLLNVFNNILDNAIKYSKEHPDICISSQKKGNFIHISFSDKGIGMSRDVQAKVFERFYRAPTGNVHNIKGFGLGLNYAKEIITAHKGDIKVKSVVDKGSTFTVILPIKQTIKTN